MITEEHSASLLIDLSFYFYLDLINVMKCCNFITLKYHLDLHIRHFLMINKRMLD
jgi:hypothetical protein